MYLSNVLYDLSMNGLELASKVSTKQNFCYGSIDYKYKVSVLDLGCNQGFFSFQCALAGAKKVIGVDITEDESTNAAYRLTFVDNAGTGYEQLYVSDNLAYNPSLDRLSDLRTGGITSFGVITSSGDIKTDSNIKINKLQRIL